MEPPRDAKDFHRLQIRSTSRKSHCSSASAAPERHALVLHNTTRHLTTSNKQWHPLQYCSTLIHPSLWSSKQMLAQQGLGHASFRMASRRPNAQFLICTIGYRSKHLMRNQGIGLFVCLWLLYQNLRWQWWIWDVNGVPFPLCCWLVFIHSNRQSPSDACSWKCQNRATASHRGAVYRSTGLQLPMHYRLGKNLVCRIRPMLHY